MSRRILYLSPVGQLGGAERCLLTVIASLGVVDADYQPYVICGSDGPLVAHARALGAAVEVLPMPAALAHLGESGAGNRLSLAARIAVASPSIWSYVRQLRRAISRINPNIIHSNGVKTHLLTRFIGRGPWAVYWHIHDFLSQRAMMSRLARPASKYVDALIAISRAVADDVRPLVPRIPVHVILNAVDTDHFTPADHRGESDPMVVGLVATYAMWKGQDIFLRAAAEVIHQKNISNIRFRIVGGPIYDTHQSQFSRQQLEQLAGDLAIGGHVEFVDFQPDPLEAYRAMDIVVHASTRPEPFGLTIAEAMSCGRAVIISNAGGAAELFTDGEDAVGVPPGDAAALADTIAKLATDPPLRRALGDNARRTAVERFAMMRLGRQLNDLYAARRLISENPPSPPAGKEPSQS